MADLLQKVFDFLNGTESKRLMDEAYQGRLEKAASDPAAMYHEWAKKEIKNRKLGTLKPVGWTDKLNSLLSARSENLMDKGHFSTILNAMSGDFDPTAAVGAKAILPPFGRKVVPLKELAQLAEGTKSKNLKDVLQVYTATRQPSYFSLLPGRTSELETVIGSVRPSQGNELLELESTIARQFPEVDPQNYKNAIAPQSHWLLDNAVGSYRHSAPTSPQGVTYTKAPRITISSTNTQPLNTSIHEGTHGFSSSKGLMQRGINRLPWKYQPHEISAVGRMVPERPGEPPIDLARLLAEEDRNPLTEILTGINANARQPRLRSAPREVRKSGRISLSEEDDAFLNTQLPTLNLDLARQGSPAGIGIQQYRMLEPIEYGNFKFPQDVLGTRDIQEFGEILKEILKIHGTLR